MGTTADFTFVSATKTRYTLKERVCDSIGANSFLYELTHIETGSKNENGRVAPMKVYPLTLSTYDLDMKTSIVVCASTKDADQLGHKPSLTRIFAVGKEVAKTLRYPLSAQRRF